MNLKEARKRLGEIVNAAEKGQCTIITRRGREVASIGPLRKRRPLPDLTAFRASLTTKGKPLSEMFIEARRKARY
jgi:prevent-host-death family protein